MITLQCLGCHRPLMTVDVRESKEPREYRVIAVCGYAGCGDHSRQLVAEGRVFGFGFYEGGAFKTELVSQETSEDEKSILFRTRPCK